MSFSLLPTNELIRPKHIYGASNPARYLEMQRMSIIRKRTDFPLLNWRMPFDWRGESVAVKVNDGHWQLICPECNGVPAYDPEWKLGACFTCGAIFHQEPPPNWRDIEKVLVARPNVHNRHMLPGQTLAELVMENVEHNDPVPQGVIFHYGL